MTASPPRGAAAHRFTARLAVEADLPALRDLMDRAIAELQRPFLGSREIAASRAVMGLDTQLVADRTYFVLEDGERLAGCGGWSPRATLYGGDHSALRDASMLDPSRAAARVRAMYTHPDFARQGVGRQILTLCEDAARTAGFKEAELMATLAGAPLYRSCGYREIERIERQVDDVVVPMVRMGKRLG